MSNILKIKSVRLVLISALFLLTPTAVQAACPGGLSAVWRSSGPICAYVYPQGVNLPAGCGDGNDLLSSVCHPELHGSYQLPGQVVTGDCVANPPGTTGPTGFLNPNCGWVFLTNGQFKWNGPGTAPSTPPPNINNLGNAQQNDIYRTCDAAAEVKAGTVPVVLFTGGTNRPATQSELGSPSFLAGLNNCAGGGGTPGGGGGTGGTPAGGTTPTVTTPTNAYLVSVVNLVNSALARLLGLYASMGGVASIPSSSQTPIASTCSVPISVGASTINVRSAPVIGPNIVRTMSAGETFMVAGSVVGELVSGINQWWKTTDGNYIWFGGTVQSTTLVSSVMCANPNPTAQVMRQVRYIKIDITKSGWISLREIELYDTSGNKVSATVSASGDYPGGYLYGLNGSTKPLSVNNLVDGDPGSVWHAGESLPKCSGAIWLPQDNCPGATRSAWIQLDLGATKDIGRVRIMPTGDISGSVIINASSDGQNFTKFVDFPVPLKDLQWREYP